MSPRGRHVPPAVAARIDAALAEGVPVAEICRRFGVARSGVYRRRETLAARQAPAVSAPPPEDRAERRDARFWRRAHDSAARDLAEAEHRLRALAGLLERPPAPPAWTVPSRSGPRRKAAGLLQVSDVHMGEVVRADEIGGLNRYDPEIAMARLRRLFLSAAEILPRWSADCALAGAVVAINGDLVSGDIHDELRRTNALTAHEQAYRVTDALAAGLALLAERFGAVWAVVTPGNHGRTTEKTMAKRTAALSYDMLIGEMLRRHFEGDRRVTVMLAAGPEAVYPVLGWTVHQSHGDSLGTGGGKGFAGPMLPIVRGTKSVEWQAYLVRRAYDIILTAHYHTSGNPGGGKLANGSVVGYSEFANRLRAGFEPPQQWLALIHERWGLRERCEIRLEDPEPPALPRLRVPAAMERRA